VVGDGECVGVTWGVEDSAMEETTTILVDENSEALLAEVIVFDQVLGEGDRRAVMDYLQARYERLRANSDG
jgi:hypothetical protein